MTSRTRIMVAVVLTLVVACGASLAAEGKWRLGARIISISPDDKSDNIVLFNEIDTGTKVAVDSATTLEVDATYYFTKNLGLEVIAATAKHDLKTSGGLLD